LKNFVAHIALTSRPPLHRGGVEKALVFSITELPFSSEEEKGLGDEGFFVATKK
jgi:hypothetical protein